MGLLPQLHTPTITLTHMLISEHMVLFHMLLISLLPQLLPTLLPNVKLKLMPIQLTSTMDTIPDMPDTAMLDGVDTHTLMLEYMVPSWLPICRLPRIGCCSI